MLKHGTIIVTLVMVLTASVASIVPACASEWSDNEIKTVEQLSDWAAKFAKTSSKVSPFTKAFAESAEKVKGFLKGTLTTVTDKTLYDPAWFEHLDDERLSMDKTVPPNLQSLNSKGAYEKIVGPPEQATYMSGQEELRTLDKVGKKRAETITKMKANRDKLQKTAHGYEKEAATATKIGDGLNKIVEKYPNIDVAFVFTGVDGYVSLTALGWNEEVVPAFNDRATAATNAVKRYDTAIKAAEADLKTFNDLKSSLHSIWSGVDTQALNPASVDMNPGAVAKLKGEAEEATVNARTTAAELQKEAADIAKHDAGISKVQAFLALARSANEVAGAMNSEQGSGNQAATTTTNATIVINNRTTVIFHVVPGAYLQQERHG